MIVDLPTAKILLDIPVTENTDDDKINLYVEGVDSLFNLLCDREFDSTSYTYELHDGDGRQYIRVKNPPLAVAPVVSIGRLAAINIRNTSADATHAMAEVDMANAKVRLVVSGGDNEDDTDVDFATYTTISAVVTQINTVGKGWIASVYDSDLDDVKSTALSKSVVSCGSQRNTTASDEYLYITGDPINISSWNNDTGQIYSSGGFPSGNENVAISYTGGYTSATMPHDLKLAVLAGIKALWDRGEEDGFGVNGFSNESFSIKYADWLPDITLKAIQDYQKEISL